MSTTTTTTTGTTRVYSAGGLIASMTSTRPVSSSFGPAAESPTLTTQGVRDAVTFHTTILQTAGKADGGAP